MHERYHKKYGLSASKKMVIIVQKSFKEEAKWGELEKKIHNMMLFN